MLIFQFSSKRKTLYSYKHIFQGYKTNDGNKSQHRKLALEMKIILPLLLGLEPATC